MKLVKVGAATINQTPLAWDKNRDRILAAIEEAKEKRITILCFPELCIPGYGSEDAFYALYTTERSWEMLWEILPHTKGMIVSLGLPTLYKNSLFNTAALVVDGELKGLVAKKFLAGDGIYYEPRWFRPWPLGAQGHVQWRGVEYPIGDIYFDVGDVRIGFEICEDAWVANRPGRLLAMEGVDLLLNPSGSHFAFGKHAIRERFVLEGSRAFGVTYLYANLLGNEAGRAIYDGGAMIATKGEMVRMGDRFSFEDHNLTCAVVDVHATRMMKTASGSYTPNFQEQPAQKVDVPFHYPQQEDQPCAPYDYDPWETSEDLKSEEFTRAVCLALFDYMRKSWSRGFVVSLSGGADSAAVATLCALSIRLAVREIGLDAVKERLGYIKEIQESKDAHEIVSHLLLCAYQSTKNSGDVTRTAAEEVAKALHAQYHELDVDSLVNTYRKVVEDAIARELTWKEDDITLQNIQARVRSPSIWMFANIRNALLLSTSNRSEAAVGYATMDGDTSGGLSPIAGIDKAFLRHWLRWVETEGPDGLGTIPALSYINGQQPTAELRPADQSQTDEGDLMPYDLLDAIERCAIGDKLGPIDIWRLMRKRFPQYSSDQMHLWVERFFKLWSRNQWKRERYAPSFHLDDQNLDPKTWCRWPILSGGFRTELRELAAYVSRVEGKEG